MADGAVAPGAGYRAFLSYSHRDEAVAARLHRKLESYRLPKALVGSEGARGIVPARLSPIFRDREELSAGESLSDRIRDALSVSDALIVLCSPAAKASHWVAQEIRLFRELHPDRPVYAALIDGEPDDAFPAPLVEGGAEPIAPDFRKGKDGASLGLIKLIAGLSGVPLDALIQRDAARQRRRVMAITLGSLAAVLIMALMLAFALRAQREAERQRAEAEGLVEYMLTDLRDKLKGVGRLDVMTAVNERAMRYYGGDSQRGLLLKARNLQALGEDALAEGNRTEAAENFDKAHSITVALAARYPGEAPVLFAHGQSEFWLGALARAAKDRSAATRHWTTYRKIAQQLYRIDRDRTRTNLELGYAHGNLCDIYSYRNFDLSAALSECDKSIAFVSKAATLSPANVEIAKTLANRYGWRANVLISLCRPVEAIGARDREGEILERLTAKDPFNADLEARLLWQKHGMAFAIWTMGNGKEAAAKAGDLIRRIDKLLLRTGSRTDLVAQRAKAVALNSLVKSAARPNKCN